MPGRRGGKLPFPPRSVLFIRPGGIGDAVLLIPALRTLQAAYPACRIEILAEKRNASAFDLCPGIAAVHRYDVPSELLGVLRRSFDVVIDTEQWYRLSAVITRLVRAQETIGFATNERGRLFTHPVQYSMGEYEAFSFLKLLAPLGIPVPAELEVPFLSLPQTARDAAQRLLAPLDGKPFAAIFPGASVPQKEWGEERFRHVAATLAASGIAVVVVGGAGERAAAKVIASDAGALDLSGKTSLLESAAVVGAARVLLSGDSGLLHLAAGLGTATVSLFGPSDPAKWAPRGAPHTVFRSTSSCAPCARWGSIPDCVDGGSCLDAEPSAVAAAVLELWKRGLKQ